jgi:hypothetical protein
MPIASQAVSSSSATNSSVTTSNCLQVKRKIKPESGTLVGKEYAEESHTSQSGDGAIRDELNDTTKKVRIE